MDPKHVQRWLNKLTPHKVAVHVRGDDEVKVIPVGTFGTRTKWKRCTTMLEGLNWYQLDALDKSGGLLGSLKRDLGDEEPEAAPAGPDMVDLAAALQSGAAPRDLVVFAQIGQMMSAWLHGHTKLALDDSRQSVQQTLTIALSLLQTVASRLEGLEKAMGNMVKQTFNNAKLAAQLAAGGGGGDEELMSEGPLVDLLLRVLEARDAKRAGGGDGEAKSSNGVNHG